MALAQALGRLGYSLALLSRNSQKTFALLAELQALGFTANNCAANADGTVTITGMVKPGIHFDPVKIADAIVQLHHQPAG